SLFRQSSFTGTRPAQVSFHIYGKCQQHIAGSSPQKGVSRADVQRSSDDDRSWAVERATVRLYSVRGLVILGGFYGPKDVPILRRIRSQVSVESARKNHAKNCGHNG